MPSLSAHLRETDDHSRLPFHPACPVCRRNRLAGSLDGEEVLSRRTQAAIAAGLLAFSTASVPAAVASPPDEIIEGTAEVVDDDPNVVLDPGGEELQLPDEPPGPDTAAPSTDLDEDAGPLEQEPATDVREPVVESNAQTIEPVVDSAPTAEPEAEAPAPEEQPAAPPTAPAESELRETQTGVGPKPEGGHRREVLAKGAAGEETQPGTEQSTAPEPAPAVYEPAPAAEIVPAPQPEPAAVTPAENPAPAATTVSTRVVGRATTGAAKPDRFHTVQRGESLWSIAADLLGDRATVPRIAREVNRLWELNDEVIGTGRPDLLYAGTRLRLR